MKLLVLILLSFFLSPFLASRLDASPPSLTGYGFILPTWIGSSSAVESFSQPNLSAYSAAANPLLATRSELPRSSFQVAQSRVGLLIQSSETLKGHVEFDFIDFSKASPTTASLPRVRRALIEYQPSPDWTLKLGQDWDLVSPLGPHSYNFVGHYFESGDVGFMRNQIQVLVKSGNFEHGFALGLPGNNNSASDGNLELGLLPTIAFRESYHFSAHSQLGFSILGTSLRKSPSDSESVFAGVATAFFEDTLGGTLELRTEAYVGESTFNLGLLGLSFRNANNPGLVRDAGAYVTAKLPLSEKLSVFSGVGVAWVLNPENMHASYSNSTGTPTLANTGPGIERNWTLRLGADCKLEEKFLVFVEFAGLFTKHHLQAADLANHESEQSALVTQLGGLLNF